ncbi:hypothetical protein [Burkholderia cepacia]|uniref:hypothetical protein n=1 Tax=Burkholderia cepacia TaxID=292 RepID=UPI0035BE7B62
MCIRLAPADRQRLDVDGCGHYGPFMDKRWRIDVHPGLQAPFASAKADGPRRHAARPRSRVTAG